MAGLVGLIPALAGFGFLLIAVAAVLTVIGMKQMKALEAEAPYEPEERFGAESEEGIQEEEEAEAPAEEEEEEEASYDWRSRFEEEEEAPAEEEPSQTWNPYAKSNEEEEEEEEERSAASRDSAPRQSRAGREVYGEMQTAFPEAKTPLFPEEEEEEAIDLHRFEPLKYQSAPSPAPEEKKGEDDINSLIEKRLRSLSKKSDDL